MSHHEHHNEGSNHMNDLNAFMDSLNDNVTEVVKSAVDHGHQHHHDHNAHAGHDHSIHSADTSHDHSGHVMKMWFHGGFNEVVLFDFWRINDWSGMLLSCILIFIMGAAYEGIKWFRVYLQMSQSSVQKCSKQDGAQLTEVLPLQSPPRRHENSTEDVYQPTTTITKCPETTFRRNSPFNSKSPFALSRLVQAGLYILQLVLAYWLMLIVMTYNNYLTAAVILGAGFGHWLFAVLKFRSPLGETADSFATDACH